MQETVAAVTVLEGQTAYGVAKQTESNLITLKRYVKKLTSTQYANQTLLQSNFSLTREREILLRIFVTCCKATLWIVSEHAPEVRL